jgi:hypothetical protein
MPSASKAGPYTSGLSEATAYEGNPSTRRRGGRMRSGAAMRSDTLCLTVQGFSIFVAFGVVALPNSRGARYGLTLTISVSGSVGEEE